MTAFSDSVRGSVADGVLIATIDNPPVNVTSADVRAGLLAARHFPGLVKAGDCVSVLGVAVQ